MGVMDHDRKKTYLSEEQSLCEKQHLGLVRLHPLEPDLVADLCAVLVQRLEAHPLGERDARDPPRLSAGDVRVAGPEQVLRDLGRLAATGVSGDNDHLKCRIRPFS